jgi:hypothetical protein
LSACEQAKKSPAMPGFFWNFDAGLTVWSGIGRTPAERAGEQRYNADQTPPACAAFEDEYQREQGEPRDDAQNLVDAANVRFHDRILLIAHGTCHDVMVNLVAGAVCNPSHISKLLFLLIIYYRRRGVASPRRQ